MPSDPARVHKNWSRRANFLRRDAAAPTGIPFLARPEDLLQPETAATVADEEKRDHAGHFFHDPLFLPLRKVKKKDSSALRNPIPHWFCHSREESDVLRSRWYIALLLMAGTTTAALAQDSADLKWKFEKGKTFYQEMTTRTEQKM